MKHARRKELKTNELSILLQQIYEGGQRHANYIIGGVVIVVLVLVIGIVVVRSRHQATQAGWRSYQEIREAKQLDAALLDRARALAAEYGDESGLGPLAVQLHGDVAYDAAMEQSPLDAESKRLELLKEAKSVYERLIDRYAATEPIVADRARMSLAGVEESLVLAGEGKRGDVEALYKALIEGETSPYKRQAQTLLDTLDGRLKQIEIVATRPAPDPPPPLPMPPSATKPAPDTTPADEAMSPLDESPPQERTSPTDESPAPETEPAGAEAEEPPAAEPAESDAAETEPPAAPAATSPATSPPP